MLALAPETFDYTRVPDIPDADRTWYIVHTKPRGEWGVHRGLRQLGYETLYLHYPGTVNHGNRKLGVLKPVFPRYLFVGLEDWQGLMYVNEFPGVSTVLYNSDGPYAVDDRTIETLRARGDENGRVEGYSRKPAKRAAELKEGQRVRITDGPLMGFFARVSVDNGQTVRVKVDMFRGLVEAELPPRALQAV